MKKLMNGAQMKRIDVYSIQEVGIPSLVLMERAALCVTEAVLEKIKKTDKVLCVCGSGNNGADGMAVARQLTCLLYTSDFNCNRCCGKRH